MNNGKDPLGALELLNMAARVEALAMEAWEESRADRITGRLARDPNNFGASCHAVVELVKKVGAFSFEIPEEQSGWILLQISMMEVSYAMWEQLWNNAHPDRFGRAWDEEDFALMSVWHEKVRTLIRECHQKTILTMTGKEYFARLTAAGEIEEVAEALADWISEIKQGTPRLLK